MSSNDDKKLDRGKALNGLLWHLATFMIIGSFLSLIIGHETMMRILPFWGVGLAFHGAWVLIDVKPWRR
jgi:uncharacterized membrane protein YwaF